MEIKKNRTVDELPYFSTYDDDIISPSLLIKILITKLR